MKVTGNYAYTEHIQCCVLHKMKILLWRGWLAPSSGKHWAAKTSLDSFLIEFTTELKKTKVSFPNDPGVSKFHLNTV